VLTVQGPGPRQKYGMLNGGTDGLFIGMGYFGTLVGDILFFTGWFLL